MNSALTRLAMMFVLLMAPGMGLAKDEARDALKDYQELVEVSDSPIYENVPDAIRGTSVTVLEVNPGFSPTRWPLTEKLPRLRQGNSISNFLLFSIEFEEGEPYELMVQSLCHPVCAGAKSSAVKPKVLLLDPEGAIVADAATKIVGLHGVLMMEVTGRARAGGSYLVLIAADNSAPGEPMVVTNVSMGNMSPMRLTMSSYPFGKIVAFAKRKKNPR